MDTDQEREDALREAERVFGPKTQSDPEIEISPSEVEQPHEEEQPAHVDEEETLAQLLEELDAQITERPIPPGTTQADDDQPWPDDMQIARSSVVPMMADTVITMESNRDHDRPTIREKYVFRIQKGRKREPLPSHLRWMRSLVEGHSYIQGK